MKVKVKSKEEIRKTLDAYGISVRKTDCCWSCSMDKYCNTVIEVEKSDMSHYDYMTKNGEWYFVKEWVDVMEEEKVMEVKVGEMALFWDYEEERAAFLKYIGTTIFDGITYHGGITEDGIANIWKYMKPIEKKRMAKKEIEEKLGIPIGSLEIVE